MRVLKENPCHAVKIKVGERPEHDCYTIEEAQHFIDLLRSEPLRYQAFLPWRSMVGTAAGNFAGLSGRASISILAL